MKLATPFLRPAAACVAALLLSTCATNPVTGRRELALISESQEIEMGRQYSAEVVQSIGRVPDQALQDYVKTLGLTLARKSERPNLPWEFHVVEDPAVNAFALPGGFIFVTRGLLTHMMNEAELVSVIGHEIGHVTARHSVQQLSRAQLAQLGLGIGMILSPTVADFGDIASAGLGLLFLKFGRDDELQADQLGFRYALDNGYDVRQMVNVFTTLDRYAQLAGAGRLPEWQSTHPNPGNRVRETEERLAAVQVDLSTRKIGASEFLTRIDGLVFGENPRLGYFEGTRFLHPDLKFRYEFPAGWKTQNQSARVVGVSSSQDAVIEIGFAEGTAADAAQKFLTQQGIQSEPTSRSNVNGLPAVTGEFSAAAEQGTLRGIATFLEYGGATYRILAYTPQDRFSGYRAAFQSSVRSFAQLTDARALAVQPMRVKVERVPRAMTLTQFNQQLPSVVALEQLALINGVSNDAQLRQGQLVKRVIR